MNERHEIPTTRHAVDFRKEDINVKAEALFHQLAQADLFYPLAVYEYGFFKLLIGDYEVAWPLFERRLGDGAFKTKGTMQLLRPFRDGSSAPDNTLMVHIEQGIGDVILCSC